MSALWRSFVRSVARACLLVSPERKARAATASSITDKQILDALRTSNLGSGFPWRQAPAGGVLRRWNLPIPLETFGDKTAEKAVRAIEDLLGTEVFRRAPGHSVNKYYEPFYPVTVPDPAKPLGIARGIFFSYGTAVGMERAVNKHTLGTTSGYPWRTEYRPNFFDNTTGVISSIVYVNIGNSLNIPAKVGKHIYIHELAHAMGLAEHFPGFGMGGVWSEFAGLVLKALYK